MLRDLFRFPEIDLAGFCRFNLGGGGGHLTPKKSLGRGVFHQRKGPHGGEFDQKNKKMSNAQGSARGGGGGGWALLDLTLTLIKVSSTLALKYSANWTENHKS